LPKIFNLRTDPYERADITSNTYYDEMIMNHAYLLVPAQAYAADFLATFKEYPQRQKAASFNLDEILEKMKESGGK
jgi:arylsulfatase